ncbi:MAG: zinc-ribbon domain-containing protein [Candidatus Eisenbacteria bacterium]|nr:zinc-ribbon domain-containing protein [Candidatus Eisenbacteria bacterium]
MNADPRTLAVACPQCGTRYLLPAHLLGPGGARVRCPGCTRSFDVPPPPLGTGTTAEAEVSRRAATPATAAAGAAGAIEPGAPKRSRPVPIAPTAQPPIDVAHSVLKAIASREGEPLERAAREGHLFSIYGPAIFEAWDEYRRQTGEAGAAPFRAALKERWGVELPEVTPR